MDEICMLSRLPETDEDSKNKEVDLKKEVWLQTLPSCVRVLLHNTDEKSMDDLSTLADEIMMSQNAACHDTSRCLPPDVMYVRRTPDVTPVRRTQCSHKRNFERYLFIIAIKLTIFHYYHVTAFRTPQTIIMSNCTSELAKYYIAH